MKKYLNSILLFVLSSPFLALGIYFIVCAFGAEWGIVFLVSFALFSFAIFGGIF